VCGSLSLSLSLRAFQRNTVIGTPFFLAPEIIQETGYNQKADIWSLGISIVEMAEGAPPHFDVHPMRVLFLIPTSPPPRLKPGGGWSDALRDFVARCLTVDPDERPDAKTLRQHDALTGADTNQAVMQPLLADAERLLRADREAAQQKIRRRKERLMQLDDYNEDDSSEPSTDSAEVAVVDARDSACVIELRDVTYAPEDAVSGARQHSPRPFGLSSPRAAQWRDQRCSVQSVDDSMITDALLPMISREAARLCELRHVHVVRLLGVVLQRPHVALVAEPLSGIRLADYVRTVSDIPQAIIAKVAREVAAGMTALHKADIAHGSLALETILLDSTTTVKIASCGFAFVKLARMVGSSAARIAAATPWLGCLAPELLDPETDTWTPAIDVYAFGVVTWELFTGQRAYASMTATEVLRRVLADDLRPSVPNDLPIVFAKLIQLCWASNPSMRPAFHKVLDILSRPLELLLNYNSGGNAAATAAATVTSSNSGNASGGSASSASGGSGVVRKTASGRSAPTSSGERAIAAVVSTPPSTASAAAAAAAASAAAATAVDDHGASQDAEEAQYRAKVDVVLRRISDILKPDDAEQFTRACGALSNLASVPRNAELIAQSGLAQRMVSLVRSTDATVLVAVCRAIAAIAAQSLLAAIVIQADYVVPKLVALLMHSDARVALEASPAVAALANSSADARAQLLAAGALAPLIRVALPDDGSEQAVAADANRSRRRVRAMVALAPLLETPSALTQFVQANGVARVVACERTCDESTSGGIALRNAAFLVLTPIATNTKFYAKLDDNFLLARVIAALSDSSSLRVSATGVVAGLARTGAASDALQRAVPLLPALVQSQSDVAPAALRALTALALHAANASAATVWAMAMASDGDVVAATLLTTRMPELMSGDAVAGVPPPQLPVSAAVRAGLVQPADVIELARQAMATPNGELLCVALASLVSLAACNEALEASAVAPGLSLDAAVDAIDVGEPVVAALACRVVALMSGSMQSLIDGGALRACARRGATNDELAAPVAVMTLASCSADATARTFLAATPCDAVVRLVRALCRWPHNVPMCERVVWGISNFARELPNRVLIIDAGADAIVSMLAAASEQARISALKTILLCAQDAYTKKTLCDVGGVDALRSLLANQENAIIRSAAERALGFLQV
jgi:serine/threonine protein kinase